jgi:hypothetical protein
MEAVMARRLIPIAFTANAFAFALIEYRSVTATIIHIRNGHMFFAALPLATAVVAFFIMMVSAMPTARANFMAKIDTIDRRNLVRSLVASLLFVTGLGVVMVFKTESKLVFGVLPEVYLYVAFGVYAVLMITAFIVPGYAFPELREVSRRQEGGVDYQSQDEPTVEEQRVIPRWFKVLLLVSLSLWMAVSIVFIYGTNADFLPLPEHVDNIGGLRTKILAVFIPLFGVLGLVTTKKPGNGIFNHKAVRLPFFVIFSGACGFLAPIDATVGLPALHSLFVTAPRVQQEVIVVKKGHGHRSKQCSNTADVTWPEVEGYLQTLCDIPRDVWETLVPGDRLLITGPRTQYGQRYDRIVKE